MGTRLLTEEQIAEVEAYAGGLNPSAFRTQGDRLQCALCNLYESVWDDVFLKAEIGEMALGNDTLIPQFYAILRGEAGNA